MSELKFNIKKQGNYFVAFDTEDKKRSYGKINIKTGKFLGDTRCIIVLSNHLDKFNEECLISKIAKEFNGDDVNVADCIFTGKKPYKKEIKFNN